MSASASDAQQLFKHTPDSSALSHVTQLSKADDSACQKTIQKLGKDYFLQAPLSFAQDFKSDFKSYEQFFEVVTNEWNDLETILNAKLATDISFVMAYEGWHRDAVREVVIAAANSMKLEAQKIWFANLLKARQGEMNKNKVDQKSLNQFYTGYAVKYINRTIQLIPIIPEQNWKNFIAQHAFVDYVKLANEYLARIKRAQQFQVFSPAASSAGAVAMPGSLPPPTTANAAQPAVAQFAAPKGPKKSN